MHSKNKINILVTGNNGYIGSFLTKMLLDKGYNVTGFDTNYYKRCQFYSFKNKIKQISKDIRQVRSEDLQNIDIVIHLASLSNDSLCSLNPKLTFSINYKATCNLANIAKRCGVKRFIFASSQSMYGVAHGKVNEDSKLNPITPYGESKMLAEKALSKLSDKDFTPCYLRPSTVFGVSPMLRLDILINNLTAWGFTTGEIQIKNPDLFRPAIHVEDVCSAFIAAVEAPKDLVFNEAFNVGENKNNFSVGDLAVLAKKFFPGVIIKHTKEENKDPRTYEVNFDKINFKLKNYFKPKWTVEKGIVQLIKAFKMHGLTYKKFRGEKYVRINHLKKLLADKKLNGNLYWKI